MEQKGLFYYIKIGGPLSYKIGQYRYNNNQNFNMHVIVTLIGNPLSFNWDAMSSTLYKMSDFHKQLFQNIQQFVLTSNIYGSSFFARIVVSA